MSKKQIQHLHYGSFNNVPLVRLIHVYDVSSHLNSVRNPKQYNLSVELQDKYRDSSPIYIMELPLQDITFFDFIIELKNLLILQNTSANFEDLNICSILMGLYYYDSLIDPSTNLMRTYASCDYIPQTNTFFVNIDAQMCALPSSRLKSFATQDNYRYPHDSYSNITNLELNIALQDIINSDLFSLYLQGEDINDPNVRTFNNFLKLFYSKLAHNNISLCPFENIIELWGGRHSTKNQDEFLDLFRQCDNMQKFQLYFTLAEGHRKLTYEKILQ